MAIDHAAMRSPVESTFIQAISGLGLRLPGLTVDMLRKLSKFSGYIQGHMDQTQHGRCSPQTKLPVLLNSDEDLFPIAVPRVSVVERVFNKLVPIHDIIRHIDLTGRLPTQGVSGAQYIMVLTCLNYIHVEPLLSRSTAHFLAAYSSNVWTTSSPSPWIATVRARTSSFSWCPQNGHRANKAERDIRTFKYHLIATLCTVDPDFPMAA